MRRTHSEPKPGVSYRVLWVSDGLWRVVRFGVVAPFRVTVSEHTTEQAAEAAARAAIATPEEYEPDDEDEP